VVLLKEQVPVATSTHRFSDVTRMDSGVIFSHSFWYCEQDKCVPFPLSMLATATTLVIFHWNTAETEHG